MKAQVLPLAVALVVGSAFSNLQAATPDVKSSPSTPVQVMNTTSSPVPVTLQGTGSITGDVNVTNTSANPVPVTGNVGITGTPNVKITGSVNVGTKVVTNFEADDLDSSQHPYGPFDLSPYSRIRLRVTANGTGTVIVSFDADGLGDSFSVDAGEVESRLYELPGTTAHIYLYGDSHIDQVFVKLFGS